jgi:8-oxo-dGTP diphosphatase
MDIAKPFELTVPSPFYRVTGKAIVFDQQSRLLVIKNHNGNWELPGGGWEHEESFMDCLKREIYEELGVVATDFSDILFAYRGYNIRRGFMTLRLVSRVKLASFMFKTGDDIQSAEFVSREQFLAMDFTGNEGAVREHAAKIWKAA